jgi:hypothetical protein
MRKMIMNTMIAALLAAGSTGAGAVDVKSPARPGELALYQQLNFNGDDYTIDRSNSSIRTDWDVRSIAIHPGDKWQICNKPRFQGDCITLTESLPDASKIGVMGQVPSAKRLDK